MVLECWSTVVRKIWTLTCPSSVVFGLPPQLIHPRNAPFVLLTSPWTSLVPKANHPQKVLQLFGDDLAFPLLKAAVKQSRVHLLDTRIGKTYNIPDAEVAQSVEQRTENPCVSGSIPLLGTSPEIVEWAEVSSRTALVKGTGNV